MDDRGAIPPADASEPDSVGVVPKGITCITCEYELGGLATDGVCPECAAPIERSMRGDWLRNADPRWLKRACLGVRMMRWAVVSAGLAFVAMLLLGLGLATVGLALNQAANQSMLNLVVIIVSLVMLAALGGSAVLYGLGTWWATTPTNPGASPRNLTVSTARWTMPFFAAVPACFVAGSRLLNVTAALPLWAELSLACAAIALYGAHRGTISVVLRELHRRTGVFDRKGRDVHTQPWAGSGIVMVLAALLALSPLLVAGGQGSLPLAWFVMFLGFIAMDGRLRAASRAVRHEAEIAGVVKPRR